MKNSFDDQLREKWEEKYFPVDEQHRQQMLELLDTNSRRKTGMFWWFGGLLLAVMVGGYILFNNQALTPNEGPPSDQLNSTESTEQFTQQQNTIDNDENNDNVDQAKTEVSSEKDIERLPDNTKQTNKASGVSTAHKSKSTSAAKKPSDVDKAKIFSKASNINTDQQTIIRQESPVYISKPVAVTVYPADDEIQNTEAISQQRNTTITPPLETLLFTEQGKSSDQPSNIKPSSSHRNSIHLFAETGTGFIPAVKQGYSSGFNFLAGGGLAYKIGAKTGIMLSAGYLLQKNGFDFERTSTVDQAGFGIRSHFNSLQPDKLHFVYSRLGLQYEMRRHLLSIHGGMQWLYGAQGNIVTNTTDQFSGESQTTQYTWLNTDGMKCVLWNSEVYYGYRITPRMIFRAGLKYNFSSIEVEDQGLADEGYSWNGQYSSFIPSLIINYTIYGNR